MGVRLPAASKGGLGLAVGLIAFGFLASRLPRLRSLAITDSDRAPPKGAVWDTRNPATLSRRGASQARAGDDFASCALEQPPATSPVHPWST
jgi:hypothetical protein